jgi:hypothetical protein
MRARGGRVVGVSRAAAPVVMRAADPPYRVAAPVYYDLDYRRLLPQAGMVVDEGGSSATTVPRVSSPEVVDNEPRSPVGDFPGDPIPYVAWCPNCGMLAILLM